MKKFTLGSKNNLTKKILVSSLLAAMTAGAAIDKQPDLLDVSVNQFAANAGSLKATHRASTTQVLLNQAGAIYVFRSQDMYYFWSINSAGTLLTLLDEISVDLSQPLSLEIGLHADTEGLFYSDNLITQASDRLSFTGSLNEGKIAIPLSKESFIPLLDAGLSVNQSATIDSNSPELQNAVSQQSDIYNTVDVVVEDLQIHADNTTALMADKVLAYKDILRDQADHGDWLTQMASDGKAQLDSEFVQQINLDVAHVEQESNNLQQQAEAEVERFEKTSIDCMQASRKRIEAATLELASTIERIEEEFDEDPRLEAQIEALESSASGSEKAMIDCVSDLGTLAEVNMENVVESQLYEQMNSNAQNLASQLEQEATQWSDDMENLPNDLMLGLQTDDLAMRTTEFEHRFARWISPAYLNKEGFVKNPAFDKGNDQHKDVLWLDKMASRGQEQLCEDETFNISFNIGVVNVVIGTFWDDQIITGNEINLVLALPGDDCVETHGGIDAVFGMPGRDRIFLGDHHDFAHGGWGMDEIHGSAGKSYTFTISGVEFEVDLGNLIMGGADDDFLYGGEINADQGEDGIIDPQGYTDIILGDTLLFGQAAGNDLIVGESGIDFLFGQRGDDTITNVGSGTITIASVPVQFGSYFFGNDGDDTITGSNTPLLLSSIGDFIFAADGNDVFDANNGRDFVFGSNGNDSGTGGGGNDFIFGSAGIDTITGGDGIDLEFGGVDDDAVSGGNGFDVLFGNRGNDRVMGEGGPDLAFGNDGNDTVDGGAFSDLLFGNAGDDVVLGQDGWDLLFGNAGRDNVSGNDGFDLIFGNRGTDRLFGNNGSDVIFGNANDIEGPLELINGGAGIDLLFGNGGRDEILGEDGLDVAFGNADNDVISGGNGLDLLFGNDGNDIVNGNADSDLLFGNAGNDQINGNDGLDVAFGNAGCDVMTGGNGVDLMFGNGNNDDMFGGNDSDLLFGNDGQDEMFGQQGADLMFGNADRDRVNGGDQVDFMFANAGNDFMEGGNGSDLMFGNDGNDFIRAGNDSDFVFGGNNNDIINAENGNDFVFGQQNNDRINSGNGTDFTFGGRGNDRLRAIEGRNFAFGNRDNDTLDAFFPGGWDARDFIFGNQNSDNLTGNNNSQRDVRVGGSGSDNRVWNTTWITAAEFAGNWVDPGCQ